MSDSGNPGCEVRLGSVLVSLLDPPRGQEAAFHRWYERDHFYAGCMVGPWFFSGRRFVATRAHKELRLPADGAVLEPLGSGSYLALYWILDGHHDAAEAWAVEQVNGLIANDRMFPGRVPTHAGFYQHAFSLGRDADGVPDALALEHPFAGVVVVMVDRAIGVEADRFEAWLRDEHVLGVLGDSPAAVCVAAQPIPLPDDAPAYVPRPKGLERRTLLLYFLDEDPRACWDAHFAALGAAVEESGLGRLVLAAPFVPTVPGTDRYADELW